MLKYDACRPPLEGFGKLKHNSTKEGRPQQKPSIHQGVSNGKRLTITDMLSRMSEKPITGLLSVFKRLSARAGPLRGLATVQVNTPRQMPSNGKQRRTPVSYDAANFTIRVRQK